MANYFLFHTICKVLTGYDYGIIIDAIKSIVDWANVYRSLDVVHIAVGPGKSPIFCGFITLTCCKVCLLLAKNIPII